ncbi:hypothetical protein [Nocardia sp. NPDC050793]|uniref:hypothetical protein n=1 Tax=Nocardia sp. NPDC050793 TaxID=3155159 RepID=UPI003410A611
MTLTIVEETAGTVTSDPQHPVAVDIQSARAATELAVRDGRGRMAAISFAVEVVHPI